MPPLLLCLRQGPKMPRSKRPVSDNYGKRGADGSAYAKVRPQQADQSTALRWPHGHAIALADCINSVLAAGHAISFARSRSGRTLSVVVLAGDDRPRWTADSEDDALELLLEVAQAAQDAAGEDAL